MEVRSDEGVGEDWRVGWVMGEGLEARNLV